MSMVESVKSCNMITTEVSFDFDGLLLCTFLQIPSFHSLKVYMMPSIICVKTLMNLIKGAIFKFMIQGRFFPFETK